METVQRSKEEMMKANISCNSLSLDAVCTVFQGEAALSTNQVARSEQLSELSLTQQKLPVTVADAAPQSAQSSLMQSAAGLWISSLCNGASFFPFFLTHTHITGRHRRHCMPQLRGTNDRTYIIIMLHSMHASHTKDFENSSHRANSRFINAASLRRCRINHFRR